MTQRLKFACTLLLTAATVWTMPAAKADQWDKLTVMTFSEPVEIPGQTLPAGTYVFRLLDSQSERCVVQIFTQDQRHLITTIIAVPDYRLEPIRNTDVNLEEREAGSPEALHSWFYAGDNWGLQFVYPKSEQHFADRSEPAAPAVQTAAADLAPEIEPAPVPVVAAVETSPSESTIVPAENFLLGDAAPAAPADSGTTAPVLPETLPETAGNFAALPLLGLLLLSGGLVAVRFAVTLS